MADINPTAQSLLNGLNSDAKMRGLMDFNDSADLSSGQFMEMISSSLSSLNDDNAAAQPYTISAQGSVKYSYNADSKESAAIAKQDAQSAAPVKAAAIDKASIKEKIKAKLKEMAAKDDTPVKDTKALKALQKVANFLIKANDDGKISLPPEMVQKLKDFVAKGDDLKAADITQFMHDFSDIFKQIIIAVPAAPAQIAPIDAAASTSDDNAVAAAGDADTLKWPSDVLDALKDLGLSGAAGDATKPLTIVDVLRTVKALVNESEHAAIKTLDDKAKETAALPQDQASILMVGNAANTAVAAKIEAKASDDTADQTITAQAAIDTGAVKDDDAVAKAIKDLQKGMEQAAQTGKASIAAPAKDAAEVADKARDKAPAADAGKIIADPIAKAFAAVKAQPTVTSLNLSNAAAPVPAAPAKAEEKIAAPSLSKISLDAQAPAQNDDKSSDSNARDNNARTAASQNSQAKTNIAANVAASVSLPSAADIKIAEPSLAVGGIDASNMTPAGLNAMSDGIKTAAAVTKAAAASSALPSNATQQVIAQIVAKGDKATQISVNLTPAELGQVEVRLNIQKDGSVHTVVTVDKPETLALLQKDSAQLERSLQQAGLNADAKNMSFNLRDGNQAQQFNQGRKRFSRPDIGNTVTEVALTVAPEGQIITDNRVNYHA